jgi:hypothetical protein
MTCVFRKPPLIGQNQQVRSFPRVAIASAGSVYRGGRRESKYGVAVRILSYHNLIADLNAVSFGLDSRLRGNDAVGGLVALKTDLRML